jgi:hypothetical protein
VIGDDISTRIERPGELAEEKRWDALRALTYAGQMDLIVLYALGLVPDPHATKRPQWVHGEAGERPLCAHCERPVSLDGRCRRSSCYPGVLAAKAEMAALSDRDRMLAAAYLSGLCAREVAEKYGSTIWLVTKAVTAAGGTMRGRGGDRMKRRTGIKQ